MATVQWSEGYKKTLSIPNAGTTSDVLSLAGLGSHGKWNVTVHSPAALTGVVKPEVSDSDAGPWTVLQSGGADISFPAAKTTVIAGLTTRFMRFLSALAEGAQRDFRLEAVRGE